jgi:2'-5' RNA ligase
VIQAGVMQGDLLGGAPSPASVHRLFFALFPPQALRERIADAAAGVERAHPSGGRLLKPDRYHLTLRFLGDFDPLPPSLAEAACTAGDAVPLQCFEWLLDHAGSFGGNGVRWLGGPPSDGLQALWRDLGDALARQGIRVARQGFVPHVTIARDARAPLDRTDIDPIRWAVDGFALVESRPGRPYEILRRWEVARTGAQRHHA